MKYIIAVHSYSYGTAQALRDYLKPNHEVLFIEHPLFTSTISHLFSMWDTFWKVIKTGERYGTFIGANPLNAFVGIILQKIGRVKRVIFLSMDFTQPRRKNKIENWACNLFDKMAFIYSDKVWNSANCNKDLHAESRLKWGLKYINKQIAIPEGTVELPFNKEPVNRTVVWVGHFKKGMGLELLIEVFNEIIPYYSLLIMGKGELETRLKSLCKTGRIMFKDVDIPEGYRILRNCAFAVAPYEPGTISQYTDPGKVKNYLSCGLPVIITKVPLIWEEIEKTKSGIAIEYDKQQLLQALLFLINNPEILKEYRKNAYELSKKYRWDKIFEEGLK